MALIIRLDIDRPYGRQPLHRHLLSRLSSDFPVPKIPGFGYLTELKTMLRLLNEKKARAYAFFRRCTLPSPPILDLMAEGRHEIGLHLENSRSEATFAEEKKALEHHIGKPISSMSKHGSGGGKYGFHHYAPYEPERYVSWARQSGMRLFLGNLEDPTLASQDCGGGLTCFPSAFWIEPFWRDTNKFTVDWLLSYASTNDTVLLIHPENVLASPELTADFTKLITELPSKILP